VTPEHVIFIPGVLLVGLAFGYAMGAKAARKELEKVRERLKE
jgi:proteasome assembly chaperone (PAC2) family protein